MSEQVNQEVHPAVIAVHDALHNFAGDVVDWAKDRKYGEKIAAVAMVGMLALAGCGNEGPSNETSSTTEGTVPVEFVADNSEACPETWEVPGVNHGEANKWFDIGQEKIATATTPEEARDAADTWVNGNEEHPGLKHDTILFTTIYNESVKPETPLATEGLVDENGCATEKMIASTVELRSVLAKSSIVPAEAPADGYNTGTDAKGNVTVAETAGVSGDRKAIEITLPDGTKFYVMARCGQPVFPGTDKPALPHGPTDETPLKTDDKGLAGDSEQHGTPDIAGDGPTGQTPDTDGYLPQEPTPTVPQQPTSTTTVRQGPPATVAPQPTSTLPPVNVTTPTTARPQEGMPQ